MSAGKRRWCKFSSRSCAPRLASPARTFIPRIDRLTEIFFEQTQRRLGERAHVRNAIAVSGANDGRALARTYDRDARGPRGIAIAAPGRAGRADFRDSPCR